MKLWSWDLSVLVLGWVLGLGTSYFGHWVQQHFEKRRRSETLKVAFRGEMNALRSALSADARAAVTAWEEKKWIKDYKLAYQRRISRHTPRRSVIYERASWSGIFRSFIPRWSGHKISAAESKRTRTGEMVSGISQ